MLTAASTEGCNGWCRLTSQGIADSQEGFVDLPLASFKSCPWSLELPSPAEDQMLAGRMSFCPLPELEWLHEAFQGMALDIRRSCSPDIGSARMPEAQYQACPSHSCQPSPALLSATPWPGCPAGSQDPAQNHQVQPAPSSMLPRPRGSAPGWHHSGPWLTQADMTTRAAALAPLPILPVAMSLQCHDRPWSQWC